MIRVARSSVFLLIKELLDFLLENTVSKREKFDLKNRFTA